MRFTRLSPFHLDALSNTREGGKQNIRKVNALRVLCCRKSTTKTPATATAVTGNIYFFVPCFATNPLKHTMLQGSGGDLDAE